MVYKNIFLVEWTSTLEHGITTTTTTINTIESNLEHGMTTTTSSNTATIGLA